MGFTFKINAIPEGSGINYVGNSTSFLYFFKISPATLSGDSQPAREWVWVISKVAKEAESAGTCCFLNNYSQWKKEVVIYSSRR